MVSILIHLLFIWGIIINGGCIHVTFLWVDDLATKQSSISSHTSKCPEEVQPSTSNIPNSRKTNSGRLVLLKGKDGNVVAKGNIDPERNIIHGHPCKSDCQIVSVCEVVQHGAQPWFEDRYGEGLTKGIFVEWPKQMICWPTDASPVHTRKHVK